MRVFLERKDDDFLFEVKNEKGSHILLDNVSKEEGEVKGMSPMEVVLASLAGCSSIDVILILKKQKINPTSVKVEVEGHRKEGEVPAIFREIDIIFQLEGEMSGEKAKRAAQLSFEKYCSVSKVLEPTAKINYQVVLNGEKI